MSTHQVADQIHRETTRRAKKFADALIAIATLPIPEQDDMLSANMRKIALDALKPWEPSPPAKEQNKDVAA